MDDNTTMARRLLPGYALAISMACVGCGARSELEALAAGGSTAAVSATNGATIGATTAVSATNGATVGATISVSATNSATTTAGTGLPSVCVEPTDTVTVSIARFNGMNAGCATAQTMGNGVFTTSFNAKIVSGINGGHIVLDECPPNANCGQELSKLDISASGISVGVLPLGAYVEVRLVVHNDAILGCRATLQLKNLPSWAGAPNPWNQASVVVLAASNADEALPDGGYEISRVRLGCYPEQPTSCGPKDDDVYRVVVGPKITYVDMGMWAPVSASPLTWGFSNLQSFTTGLCDDPPHAAYLLFVVQ